MIDQPPEHIDPLKIAADLLRLKGNLPGLTYGSKESAEEQAMRLGAVAIRLLFDENARLKARISEVEAIDQRYCHVNLDLTEETNDLRALVKAQDDLLLAWQSPHLPPGESPDCGVAQLEAIKSDIRELKAKLGIDKGS